MNSSTTNFMLSDTSTYTAGMYIDLSQKKLKSKVSYILSFHSLTITEWIVLGLINDKQHKKLNLGDLAHKLKTSAPYVTKIINGLMAKDFIVTRVNHRDNRIKELVITKEAESKFYAIEQEIRNNLNQLFNNVVDKKDLQAYIKVCYLIANQI